MRTDHIVVRVHSNLLTAEANPETLVSCEYLEHQHGAQMQRVPSQALDRLARAQVISWLVEVAGDCTLKSESLFLAVALLDRYLTETKVQCLPKASPLVQPYSVIWMVFL